MVAHRDAFGRLLGRHVGGCEDCDAYSELVDTGGGVYVLTIRHDDTCPTYRAMQHRQAKRS